MSFDVIQNHRLEAGFRIDQGHLPYEVAWSVVTECKLSFRRSTYAPDTTAADHENRRVVRHAKSFPSVSIHEGAAIEHALPELRSQRFEHSASSENANSTLFRRSQSSRARAALKCRSVGIHTYSLNGMVHYHRITVKTHFHKGDSGKGPVVLTPTPAFG